MYICILFIYIYRERERDPADLATTMRAWAAPTHAGPAHLIFVPALSSTYVVWGLGLMDLKFGIGDWGFRV